MLNEANGNFTARTLRTSAELADAFADTVKWANRMWMAYAWAGGDETDSHLRALDLRKIERVALGVDFCQTDPAVIRGLHATGKLRLISIPNTVFHPKLLVAEGKDGWRALIGSSNFTRGGFGRNVEVNVLLHHADASALQSLREFVDEHWEGAHAFELNEQWLAEYQKAFEKRPKPPSVPKHQIREIPMPAAFRDLEVGWPEYYELVQGQEKRLREYNDDSRVLPGTGASYLSEIEACQAAFRTPPTDSFAQIDTDKRKLIAGWPNYSSGYLGRMGGAGDFKKIIGSRPEVVGIVLDRLPLEGAAPIELATEVVNELWSINRLGPGAVSRLLAVKRPDLFVPANNASFTRQKLFFGRKPDTAAKYVEMLKRIWQLPWFNAPAPSDGLESRVWRARVALLDALFYVPTVSNKAFSA